MNNKAASIASTRSIRIRKFAEAALTGLLSCQEFAANVMDRRRIVDLSWTYGEMMTDAEDNFHLPNEDTQDDR